MIVISGEPGLEPDSRFICLLSPLLIPSQAFRLASRQRVIQVIYTYSDIC